MHEIISEDSDETDFEQRMSSPNYTELNPGVSGDRASSQQNRSLRNPPSGGPNDSNSQRKSFNIDTFPLLYLEVQINDLNVAPLLIFRKDNIEQKLEEFAMKYKLPEKKRVKLYQTVAHKMNSLQDFVPEEKELTSVVVRQEELASFV